MAFGQHELGSICTILTSAEEGQLGSCTTDSSFTATFDHVGPLYDPLHQTAGCVNPSSQYQVYPDGFHTSKEWGVNTQEHGSLSEYCNTNDALSLPMSQQHSVIPCLIYMVQLPVLSKIASTHQNLLATREHTFRTFPVPGWTQGGGDGDSGTSAVQSTHNASIFEGSEPQWLSLPESTALASGSPQSNVQFELQSPCNNQEHYTCEECSKPKSDFKSLKRHINEVHRKPLKGQIQKEWFQCACGYQAHYSRRANYTRHLRKCSPDKWLHQFICQCLIRHTEKEDHDNHYKACKGGQGHVGRPRRLV